VLKAGSFGGSSDLIWAFVDIVDSDATDEKYFRWVCFCFRNKSVAFPSSFPAIVK
jgi:hypothetical protein